MQIGDIIINIEGHDVVNMSPVDISRLLSGPQNKLVALTIVRGDVQTPIKMTVGRAKIMPNTITYYASGTHAYIAISSFSKRTAIRLAEAYSRARREIGSKLNGIILDLRNNPGGLLDQAIIVSDAFLDKGQIVSTRGRHSRDSQRFDSRPGDLAEGKPVIVIINGGSASASEIVAGALQDHKRAIVLGTKSFGKGSVQVIIPLNGGSDGALKLTNARYFTPSGRSIQAKGIEPDIEVHQFTPEGEKLIELPSEADLRNHLEGDETEDPSDGGDAVSESVIEDVPAEILELDRPLDEDVEDYQLARAMQILQDMAANSTLVQDTTSTQSN